MREAKAETENGGFDRPWSIGTRGSPLALAQAHETQDRLAAALGLR